MCWMFHFIQVKQLELIHVNSLKHGSRRELTQVSRMRHASSVLPHVLVEWKWKSENGIQPSMVTLSLNSCSTFTNPSAHTHSNEHTHTRSSGQPFMLQCPGSSWGFGALLKGHLVMVLKVERALYIHSSTDNPCWTETETRNLSIMSPTPYHRCGAEPGVCINEH